MAVSKRLRYEILRRDDNACRYCGGVAPDVVLTVDHVVPVALGGSDDPSNLVAACKDCNSGKSATPADASLVEDISLDAIRWADALRAAYSTRIADMEQREGYVQEFMTAWRRWTFGSNSGHLPLPDDWERSVAKWYALGIPIEVLCDAINAAMPRTKIPAHDMFRYMAGIVWNVHTETQQSARALLEVELSPEPPATTECAGGHPPVTAAIRYAGAVYSMLARTCDGIREPV